MIKRIPLLIFGAGKVGRALVRQLIEATPLHAERDGLGFHVVAWCDSDGAVVDPDGIGPELLQAISANKASGVPLAALPVGYPQNDLVAIVDVAGVDGCIVADVTATSATVPALELALRRGYAAATANKVPLTGPQATFDRLVGSRRLRYESTVGSAVPVIEALHGLLRAADRDRRGPGRVERHAGLHLHRVAGGAVIFDASGRSDASRLHRARPARWIWAAWMSHARR